MKTLFECRSKTGGRSAVEFELLILRDYLRHPVAVVTRLFRRSFGDVSKRRKFHHNAIWSFPRSGNHWVRFIAEYLSDCPTRGHYGNPMDTPIFLNTFTVDKHPLSHVNPENPFILYKSHERYWLSAKSAILLLIRNYREVVAFPLPWFGTRDPKEYIKKQANKYVDLIAGYDLFSGAKILIYYEDLLADPEREIDRIKNFLGAPNQRYTSFMERYDYYKQCSMAAKNRLWLSDPSVSPDDRKKREVSADDIQLAESSVREMVAIKSYHRVIPYLSRYE